MAHAGMTKYLFTGAIKKERGPGRRRPRQRRLLPRGYGSGSARRKRPSTPGDEAVGFCLRRSPYDACCRPSRSGSTDSPPNMIRAVKNRPGSMPYRSGTPDNSDRHPGSSVLESRTIWIGIAIEQSIRTGIQADDGPGYWSFFRRGQFFPQRPQQAWPSAAMIRVTAGSISLQARRQ